MEVLVVLVVVPGRHWIPAEWSSIGGMRGDRSRSGELEGQRVERELS